MNAITQHFELLLTLAVFICLIFYIIDGLTYRKMRNALYQRFLQQNTTEEDQKHYLGRLGILHQKNLPEKSKAHIEQITQKLIANQPLTKEELYWLKRPVYPKEKFIEFFSGMFWVLFIVWFARSFVYEPFKIPSASMEPTLQAGDFILANKFTYGIRLPVLHKKIIETGAVKHGDIIVFNYPRDEKIKYIKRVIGLPGDKIRFDSGRVWINDQEQPFTPIGENNNFSQFTETLNGKNHLVQFSNNPYQRILLANEITVPPAHYFVMGDNRDNSQDSRFWGFVPEENLVGKAVLIWLNSDCLLARGHCGRIGTSLK